jgi:hypothetical protein
MIGLPADVWQPLAIIEVEINAAAEASFAIRYLAIGRRPPIPKARSASRAAKHITQRQLPTE